MKIKPLEPDHGHNSFNEPKWPGKYYFKGILTGICMVKSNFLIFVTNSNERKMDISVQDHQLVLSNELYSSHSTTWDNTNVGLSSVDSQKAEIVAK